MFRHQLPWVVAIQGSWKPTRRIAGLSVEPNLDQAKGVGPLLPDLPVGGEAGAGVDEERLRVEEVAAALQLLGPGGRRKEVDPVDVAEGDEFVASGIKFVKIAQGAMVQRLDQLSTDVFPFLRYKAER